MSPKAIKCVGTRRDRAAYIRRNSTTLRQGFILFMSEGEQRLLAIEASEIEEFIKIKEKMGHNAIFLLEIEEGE